MNKINAMYKVFGTDYRHTCYECNYCQKHQKGSRSIYKCKIYGNTDSSASDWKASNIACKCFNKDYSGAPIIELVKHQPREDQTIEGQITIEEYIKATYIL